MRSRLQHEDLTIVLLLVGTVIGGSEADTLRWQLLAFAISLALIGLSIVIWCHRFVRRRDKYILP